MFFLVVADLRKVHTVSRKSERLVNLTIALLATKRYLTKAEIFSSVAGYSGDPEAKDRMFERDKDDLRSLGINIELGTFDPLFEDEAGYRIKPETYELQLTDLNPTEIALLSHAAQLWRDAALGDDAQIGLRKLKALGLDSDLEPITGISSVVRSAPEQIADIIEAITERRSISFEYLDADLAPVLRSVNPYRLSNSRGYWYLIGFDNSRESIRTFRLDRFASTVKASAGTGKFDVDFEALESEEQSHEEIPSAVVRIRRGRSHRFGSARIVREIDSDWLELEVSYHDKDWLIQEILWCGTNALLVEPTELRDEIISRLERAVLNHG
jgi:proteasome accessory factor B